MKWKIVVDAYNESERAMGWYCYLEERLKFPFKARCKSKRAVLPLRIGEEVTVVGMAPDVDCESQMFVRLEWDGRNMAVSLSQLEPLATDPQTKEAVADWHYWVARGYEF